MTYNRDDDRYYRRELQALKDFTEDMNAQLTELLLRLRDADELRTYEARVKITDARRAMRAAGTHVQLALLRLPDPVTA